MAIRKRTNSFYADDKVINMLRNEHGLYMSKLIEFVANDMDTLNYVIKRVPISDKYRRPEWLKSKGYIK